MVRIKSILLYSQIVLVILFALSELRAVAADSRKTQPKTKTTSAATAPYTGSKPSKSLTFEDELVEGLNRNPFDSLTSVRTKDMKDTARLYRVKGRFSLELKMTAEEAAYGQ